MRCMGVDGAYAKPVAFAYRHGCSDWPSPFVVGKVECVAGALEEVFLKARAYGVERVMLEDCFLGLNPQTFKALAKAAVVIQEAATRVGLEVKLVPPETWKRACLTQGRYFPRTRAEQKALAILRAKGLGAPIGKDDDLADAVCLADFGDSHPDFAEAAP